MVHKFVPITTGVAFDSAGPRRLAGPGLHAAVGLLAAAAAMTTASVAVPAEALIEGPAGPLSLEGGRNHARVTLSSDQHTPRTFRLVLDWPASTGHQPTTASPDEAIAAAVEPAEVSVSAGRPQTIRLLLAERRQLPADVYRLQLRAVDAQTGRVAGQRLIEVRVPQRIAIGDPVMRIDTPRAADRAVHGTLMFPIEANVQAMTVTITATPLAVGPRDSADGGQARLLPLDTSEPIVVVADDAHGAPRRIAYLASSMAASYRGPVYTEPFEITAASAGGIATRLYVKVAWSKPARLLPAGHYVGRVTLNVTPSPRG